MKATTLELPNRDDLLGLLGTGETLVGVQPIRSQPDGPPCAEGCMAPGSSPHYHTTVVGWRVIGTESTSELDADGMCVRQSVIYTY